ncbi:N-acetylmuramoyl-L-alanine amidase [Clostridium tetani]|uniref:hypothetical protein n=1 Tax=Clostridium tetani TaxID=1513 RepID=UPI0005740D31|nr:hypothetical protein [Clostridium tetani]KHO39083.1 N-acetylmuramoyl-L-alanine amidase [Clostridium tetani]BDR67207.1 hypothetical protein K144312032_14350 [Clostridium tetani]
MTNEQRKAVLVIKNYLNKDLEDDYILTNYDLAVEQLINNAAKLENITPGVKSMSEGNQSISFESAAGAWRITDDVKALLPTPYIRMW